MFVVCVCVWTCFCVVVSVYGIVSVCVHFWVVVSVCVIACVCVTVLRPPTPPRGHSLPLCLFCGFAYLLCLCADVACQPGRSRIRLNAGMAVRHPFTPLRAATLAGPGLCSPTVSLKFLLCNYVTFCK